MASPTPLGIHQISSGEQYALVADLNRVGVTTDAAIAFVKDRAEYLTDKAVAEAGALSRRALNELPGRVVAEVDRVIGDTREDAAEALATANKAYEYNQALAAPAAAVVNAVVTDPTTPAGSLVDSIARRSGRTVYADAWYDEAATDHRPLVQAALDAAQAGDTVVFGPGRTWVLASKTKPGADAYTDRVLVKKPGVHITMQPGAMWRVDPVLGKYSTVLGNDRDGQYETGCTLTGIAVDHNARGGATMPKAEYTTFPRMAIRLLSYTSGAVITIDRPRIVDADSTNCIYIGAHHIRIIEPSIVDACRNSVEWHDHSSIYTSCTVAGGTQTWTGGSYSGGGKASQCPVEIHGGTVSQSPWSATGYATAANLCGAPNAPLVYSCPGVTISGGLLGVSLWSSPAVGQVAAVDLTLNMQIDRNFWESKGLGYQPYGTGLDLWYGSTTPIKTLRVRGVVEYLPSTATTVTGDHQSCALRLLTPRSAQDAGMKIEEVDIDLRVLRPYAAGALIGTVLRRGRVRLEVTDPLTSASTVPALYGTGMILSESEVHDVDIDVTVRDTRAAPKVTSCMVGVSGATGFRAASNVDARLRVTTAAGTSPPLPWQPSVTAAGSSGVRSHVESATTFLAPWGALRGGSEFHNPATGKRMRQTTYPAGSTWVEVTA